MSVKDSNIQTQLEERLGGWRINESVWDWIVRKTGIKPTIGGIEELAGKANISRTALRKLKKTQQHSLSRQDLRDSLAKYTFEIPGVKEPVKLGYYGYPPGYTYVELASADQEDHKRLPTQSLSEAHRKDFPNPEARLSPEQKEINNRIKTDFDNIIELSKPALYQCEHCESVKYDDDLPDQSLVGIELPEDCVLVHFSTHKDKLYGAASVRHGKGFELEVKLCKSCLNKLSETFLIPVSSLIKKIMSRYRLNQPEVASEIGVPQVAISRLRNDKTDFVKPDLLKKLYELWWIGPEVIYKNEHRRLIPFILDEIINNEPDHLFIREMEIECDPWYPPWKEDWEFLIKRGAITEPPGFSAFRKSDYFDFSYDGFVIESDFLGMCANSNEVSFDFRVKYRFSYLTRDQGHRIEGGILSIRYVLVDIRNRLISEYLFFESECSYKDLFHKGECYFEKDSLYGRPEDYPFVT